MSKHHDAAASSSRGEGLIWQNLPQTPSSEQPGKIKLLHLFTGNQSFFFSPLQFPPCGFGFSLMNVEDSCATGSTDDVGANRGHWGPNPGAAVLRSTHMLFLLPPRCHTVNLPNPERRNLNDLCQCSGGNLGRGRPRAINLERTRLPLSEPSSVNQRGLIRA